MKKQLLISLLMLISIVCISQTVSSNYFEVYTKLAHSRPSSGFRFNRDSILARINNIPDTANTFATFVVSVNNPALADSLTLTLVNSLGQTVYSGGGNISTLQSSPSYRRNGNTLYFTVGPFPYLKHFSATARVKGTDGNSTPIKSFAKN